jgi:hypothetical protein
MSAKKVNKVTSSQELCGFRDKMTSNIIVELFIFIAIISVLFMTSLNIKNYLTPKKVLGANIQVDRSQNFWQDFLVRNPNYIPGWIEAGRIDRVKEIDPNYIIP